MRRAAATGTPRVEQIPGVTDTRFDSIKAAAVLERDGGVYAAFGTQNGRRVIRLGAHFDRLVDSASRIGFGIALDPALLGSEICTVMDEAGFREARVRVSAHPESLGSECPLTVAVEEFAGVDPEVKQNGVVCTTSAATRGNPRAKQTGWLAERAALPDGAAPAYERLLLDTDGGILEGTGSNFYAIVHQGNTAVLRTAGAGILHGISRSIVLEVAPALARVELTPLGVSELSAGVEAFLTSASRGIIPIVQVNEIALTDGPGTLTRQMSEAYDKRSAELEEPLCESQP